MRRRLALAALLVAVSACEPATPFIFHEHTLYVGKEPDQVRTHGGFVICHGDDDMDKVAAMAVETCGNYGLQPVLQYEQRYQCAMTEPHSASYACIDPRMRMGDGTYVNPFNKRDMRRWRAEQAEAGKKPGQAGAPVPQVAPLAPQAEAAPAVDKRFDMPAGGWGQAWDEDVPKPR
jgi:hypothetical protein